MTVLAELRSRKRWSTPAQASACRFVNNERETVRLKSRDAFARRCVGRDISLGALPRALRRHSYCSLSEATRYQHLDAHLKPSVTLKACEVFMNLFSDSVPAGLGETQVGLRQ